MRSLILATFLITFQALVFVARALPLRSSVLRTFDQLGTSADGEVVYAPINALSLGDESLCSVFRYWDLPNISPYSALATIYSVIGILAGLDTNIGPYAEKIWLKFAQELSTGESCPLATIQPHMSTIARLVEEAAGRIEHTPPIHFSQNKGLVSVEDCSRFSGPVFASTQNISPIILSLLSLMNGVSRLCGTTRNVAIVGESLTDLVLSIEHAVPGVQLIAAADPVATSSAAQARALGLYRLADFLLGL